MTISHRISRKWSKLSRKAIGKILKLRDNNFPKYSKPKRQNPRWAWKEIENGKNSGNEAD